MSNKIIDYVMNSPQNTNPNVLKGLLESSEQESSDFSTAKVTIINNTSAKFDCRLPVVIDMDWGGYLAAGIRVQANSSVTFTVVMYDGTAIFETIETSESVSLSATGEISLQGNIGGYIGGDGTITISTAL